MIKSLLWSRFVTETTAGSKTYNALYSGDVNFTAGTNPTLSLTINPNVPANNNTGNNSAADPVLIDAFYVHPDHLGTPRAVTNPSTNLKVWEWESTPFGETLANENPQNLTGTALATGQFRYNLRFPGQFFDAESGKHYNYFRDYDPSIGRFPQSDPIGLAGGISTYGYARGSPLRYFDPDGLCVEDLCIIESLVLARAALWAVGALGAAAGAEKAYNAAKDCDNCSLMSKGGKKNIDNEYVRHIQSTNCPDPCGELRGLYAAEGDPIERQKIRQAMKRFNCDGGNRFDKYPKAPKAPKDPGLQ